MNLHTLYQTQNDCYKAGKRIQVRGIQVHSSGANNPYLKRYVGPDDGLLGDNVYNNTWNRPGVNKCASAWIGKLQDGTVATYQCLPWDMRCWLSGSGFHGNANNTMIGFEIAEDGLSDPTYFNAVYREAVELCAYLCGMFGLDPLADGVILGHYELAQRGIGSNHADPRHWFSKHGKSMDAFRAAVRDGMGGAYTDPTDNPALPPEAPDEPPTRPETAIHIVARGDTLYSLAKRYGTTVGAIVDGNNLPNPNLIQIGQRLVMPLGVG